MDFRTEFFPLLNKALFKNKTSVSSSLVESSDMYMFDRYISFYHHSLVELINNTLNKFLKDMPDNIDGQYLYETLDSILPKFNKSYISYFSKKKLNLSNVKDITTFIKTYSRRHNISEHKVYEMLTLYSQLKK